MDGGGEAAAPSSIHFEANRRRRGAVGGMGRWGLKTGACKDAGRQASSAQLGGYFHPRCELRLRSIGRGVWQMTSLFLGNLLR